MAATKCPQQAGGRQRKKNNPTGRKGRKRRITTLSTRSMELVKAIRAIIQICAREARNARTHARTRARCSSAKPRSSQQGTQCKRKEKEKKTKRKTWLKGKGKNWLSNLTRVKSTTLSTHHPFHLLLSVFGHQLPIVANSILPNVFIHSTRSDLQPGRNQGLLALNQAGVLARL